MGDKYSVSLSDGKCFEVFSGETILEASIRSGIHLEYSCKDGRCGVCKAKLNSGETYEIIKSNFLTDEDKIKNNILTCCSGLKSDIKIDAEDLFYLSDITTKILPCRIDSISRLSNDVISLILRLPPNSNFNYLAGQHISLIGPSGEKRSYSVASYKMRKRDRIELIIKLYSKGLFSDYFVNDLKVNDLMRFEGPLGTFFLRDLDIDRIIFIATGTGIAPIKAMLEDIDENGRLKKYKEVLVYYGVRNQKDVFFDYKKFTPDGIDFRFVYSTKNDEIKYVQDAVVADFSSLEKTCIYACGSDVMIKSAFDKFSDYNLDHKLFFSDIFLKS